MYFPFSIFVFCHLSTISSVACIDLPITETTGEPYLQGNPMPGITNETLNEFDMAKCQVENNHKFYKSWIKSDIDTFLHYWVDLNSKTETVIDYYLSQSYEKAVSIQLPFTFPFYGHKIDNVMIATFGVLFTQDHNYSQIIETHQYIAPLRADFDPNLSNDSYIKYFSNSTTFTVLWENVALSKLPSAGYFTFEVTLCQNGDIIFVYKNIPVTPETHDEDQFKIGLSDSYLLKSENRTQNDSYYDKFDESSYGRIYFDIKNKDLKNLTVIYFTAQQTCYNKTTCESCLAKDVDFDCQWCDGLCSNGLDRRRQDWIEKGCDERKVNETRYCHITNTDAHTNKTAGTSPEESSSRSVGFLFFFTVICITVVAVWLLYAYRNPHSRSGQILLRYRPSRWSCWRNW